ncbi:MAG: hypothetical protein LBC55_07555 [Desulfovibrio sp.]|jgi:hypothetical protein|nr:hypothetical protein [Desulfovibrio sp.]
MRYRLEFAEGFEKRIASISMPHLRRALLTTLEAVSALENPRSHGGTRHGGKFWGYPVFGSFFICCQIDDTDKVIRVFDISV